LRTIPTLYFLSRNAGLSLKTTGVHNSM